MKNLRNLYLDACDILDDLEIAHEPVTSITANSRYTARWGTCTHNKRTGRYNIEIASILLQDDISYEAAMDTVIHEVLHCHKDRLCHTGEWKRCADLVNRNYPQFHISRCTSASEKGVAERQRTYPYQMRCKNCGHVYKNQRMTKAYKRISMYPNSHNYTCGVCKSKELEVIR